MKIAVTARGPVPESAVDERLGRAYWILVFNVIDDSWYAIDNSLIRNSPHGAGERAAKAMVDHGVEVVITGETGPKAFRTLNSAGIGVCHGAAGTAEEMVRAWKNGKLVPAVAPNDFGSPYCLIK